MTISKDAERIIRDVFTYFLLECVAGKPLENVSSVYLRATQALKISYKTLKSIIDQPIDSPRNKVGRITVKKITDIDQFTQDAIRRLIYSRHAHGKKVTLSNILKDIRNEGIPFHGGRGSLHKVFKTLNFSYDRINVKTIMMEKPYIVSWRHRFLREFMANKNSPTPRTVVWLDETWITLYGHRSFCWQDGTSNGLPNWRASDGRRFIVLHAGTSEGWIDGASLLFASKSNNTDYHGEMNGNNFLRWCLKQLIKNLPPNCLIVMDNAPYHTVEIEKQPTTAWKKGDLILWLQDKNVTFDESLKKKDLLELAMRYKEDRKWFVVDEILRQNGHDVLRLPPYHFHFNAIEMCWGVSKNYYNETITEGNLYDEQKTREVWEDALERVTPDVWANSVRHTEDLIEKTWERELPPQSRIPVAPLIISLEEDVDTDDDEYYEEDTREDITKMAYVDCDEIEMNLEETDDEPNLYAQSPLQPLGERKKKKLQEHIKRALLDHEPTKKRARKNAAKFEQVKSSDHIATTSTPTASRADNVIEIAPNIENVDATERNCRRAILEINDYPNNVAESMDVCLFDETLGVQELNDNSESSEDENNITSSESGGKINMEETVALNPIFKYSAQKFETLIKTPNQISNNSDTNTRKSPRRNYSLLCYKLVTETTCASPPLLPNKQNNKLPPILEYTAHQKSPRKVIKHKVCPLLRRSPRRNYSLLLKKQNLKNMTTIDTTTKTRKELGNITNSLSAPASRRSPRRDYKSLIRKTSWW